MSEVYLSELSKINLDWKRHAYRPKNSDWPDSIYLEDNVVKELKYLEDYTREKTFGIGTIRNGSTGWEYSETAVYLGKKLFFSKPKAGDYNSVVPELRISKPVLKPFEDKIDIKFSIGDKNISTNIKRHILEEDNAFGPVFVVHTHPKSRVTESKEIYTFFSTADLKFLHQSPIYMLGMISKNTLWLVCETDQFNSINSGLLHGATLAELEGGDDAIKKYIAENLASSGLIFYHGTFGSKIRRIEYDKYQFSKSMSKPLEPIKMFAENSKDLGNNEHELGMLKLVKVKKTQLQNIFLVILFTLMIVTLLILLKIVGIL
ncbi:MAG: hypothetical protein ACMG57_01720 [Candidatus Dojkabacteria bacterium]